jgi:3-dehydroquinate dehydratase/shikimate dehydrogenase
MKNSLLERASAEIASGSSFLEFRIDFLRDPFEGVSAVEEITRKFPECQILATCRRHQNHGRFNGSVDEQIDLLEKTANAGAFGVDVEIESAEVAKKALERLRRQTHLILSYHNFNGTPPMDKVLRRMMKISAEAYKLVTTARKPSDLWRLLQLAKKNPKLPLILLSMGEVGFPSRVLSLRMGCLYSYAAPDTQEGTAPGQIPVRAMRNIYRVENMRKDARIYGVIAAPVRHSLSPQIHNRAFQFKRMNAMYLPFLVENGQLKDFMTLASELPIRGFNVTIPHKQKVLRYLDIVDPLAKRIGAVNTIWKKGGKWRGTTTDVEGTLKPLAKKLRLSKSKILIAGSGGAARTAAFALSDAGAKVTMTGRNADRERALAKAVSGKAMLREEAECETFDAVVHATPLGMYPNVEDCFFDERIPAEVVFDMVYNPMDTALLKRARQEKKETVDGMQMFIEQAAQAFQIWTEESPPRRTMNEAAMEALNEIYGGE